MLSVIMLNVVLLSVVAPIYLLLKFACFVKKFLYQKQLKHTSLSKGINQFGKAAFDIANTIY
jgi:hypothetical protein